MKSSPFTPVAVITFDPLVLDVIPKVWPSNVRLDSAFALFVPEAKLVRILLFVVFSTLNKTPEAIWYCPTCPEAMLPDTTELLPR